MGNETDVKIEERILIRKSRRGRGPPKTVLITEEVILHSQLSDVGTRRRHDGGRYVHFGPQWRDKT